MNPTNLDPTNPDPDPDPTNLDPDPVLGAPWEGPLGTKLEPKTGPAPVRHRGPKKCLKCVTVVKNRPRDKLASTARPWDFGTP